jgi:hypothetical protein
MRFFSLRAIFLLGFIVAMPVLALPSVARRVDNWLYGPPPADFGRAPAAPLAEAPVAPMAPSPLAPSPVAKSPIVPARFDEPSPAPQYFVQPAQASGQSPAAGQSTTAAVRYEPATLPPLPVSPPFAAPEAAPPSEPKIDERTIARLQQIRERLEQLGAEYVLVDMQDSGRFRFHCRMLVDPRTRYSRPFDATSFDPIVAGEQVLGEVEKWRQVASGSSAVAAP